MIQTPKRWAFLAALAAAAAYGFSNFQIGGLEHLRLETRKDSSAATERLAAGPAGSSAWPLFDESQGSAFGGASVPGYTGSSATTSGWGEQLSLAEKFSMWEIQRSASSSATGDNSQLAPLGFSPSMPVSTPIPLPPGLNPAATFPQGTTQPFSSVAAALPAILPTVPDSVLSGSASLEKMPTYDVGFGSRDKAKAGTAPLRIKVASFNLQAFGPAKLAKPELLELLVRILRQYEVVALQEVRSTRDDILPMLVERLNQSGRSYDYLVGPRVGQESDREQYAFVFDTSRVETDRYQLYTVEDPDSLITFDPLVAWFRCKGLPADRAFTFSIVNLHVDASRGNMERELISNLIQAIENDGRHEDDWIILGDLDGGPLQLPKLSLESARFAFSDIPTDVMGQKMRSAIIFSAQGTTEFTGRAGAFDFLRKYNLSLERALEVSEHLPVWAEFSAVEGAEPGRIAPFQADEVF